VASPPRMALSRSLPCMGGSRKTGDSGWSWTDSLCEPFVMIGLVSPPEKDFADLDGDGERTDLAPEKPFVEPSPAELARARAIEREKIAMEQKMQQLSNGSNGCAQHAPPSEAMSASVLAAVRPTGAPPRSERSAAQMKTLSSAGSLPGGGGLRSGDGAVSSSRMPTTESGTLGYGASGVLDDSNDDQDDYYTYAYEYQYYEAGDGPGDATGKARKRFVGSGGPGEDGAGWVSGKGVGDPADALAYESDPYSRSGKEYSKGGAYRE